MRMQIASDNVGQFNTSKRFDTRLKQFDRS
jgi:hypothetical protein